MQNNFPQKIVIGSEEWCSLPSLNIPAIKARVDSGAKTSSIHAYNIKPFVKQGQRWVSFDLAPLQSNGKTNISCEMAVHDRRTIKSSNGSSEQRYVIIAKLELGNAAWDVEVTLTNRDSMGYRMLLGREAISGRAVVDPSESLMLRKYTNDEINQIYKSPVDSSKGLKIGLLASNPNLYSNQRLLEAAELRGHQIEFLDIKQCFMQLDGTNPAVNYRGNRNLNHLDAIIPRIRPAMTFYGCALVRQFESLDIFSLNSAESILQSRDKLFSLQKLFKGGLDIPTSGFADSPQETEELIKMVGGAPGGVLEIMEEWREDGRDGRREPREDKGKNRDTNL